MASTLFPSLYREPTSRISSHTRCDALIANIHATHPNSKLFGFLFLAPSLAPDMRQAPNECARGGVLTQTNHFHPQHRFSQFPHIMRKMAIIRTLQLQKTSHWTPNQVRCTITCSAQVKSFASFSGHLTLFALFSKNQQNIRVIDIVVIVPQKDYNWIEECFRQFSVHFFASDLITQNIILCLNFDLIVQKWN